MFATMIALVCCLGFAVIAADSTDFRGPDRNGIFTAETGLLKQWPEAGPKRMWTAEGLGQGYASVTVVGGKVYTTGKFGDSGALFAFDNKGKQLWRTDYGDEFHGSGYPGSRTTPTYYKGSLYLMTSLGTVVAADAETGKIKWKVDVLARFGEGQKAESLLPKFGIAESLLVVDDQLICTPGTKKAVMAALSLKDGQTLWTTPGNDEISAYCSPRLYEDGGHRFILTMTAASMIAVNPKDGALIFRQSYPATYNIHAVSPVWQDGYIYVSDGYGQGGSCFKLADDGKSVSLAWREKTLDIHHGGTVLVDGVIYGASNSKHWISLDLKTGKVLETVRRQGKGALIYADGRLIGYTEKGEVVMAKPNKGKIEVVSRFEMKEGSGHHWSHPVVNKGTLYVRHGKVLAAFDVRAN
ncbi:PQQ-binding-like beta-propeller repeat protein [Acanthopleuribacter pedis]|nr:PQQ-binding-like beta-propeller repeat protein [Acanthopleuribacter pedis]